MEHSSTFHTPHPSNLGAKVYVLDHKSCTGIFISRLRIQKKEKRTKDRKWRNLTIAKSNEKDSPSTTTAFIHLSLVFLYTVSTCKVVKISKIFQVAIAQE